MKKNSKIYVAGHKGLVGSAILRKLTKLRYKNLIVKDRQELDLTNQSAVSKFFNDEKPEYVFLAAAKVGGILSSITYPADFIYNNLEIQNNVIYSSFKNNVKKLLFLGSSCIYPKLSPQPMKEEYLLTGNFEPTNQYYSTAKIAGIKLCQALHEQYGVNFISVMPTNQYGINDNFDLKNSHVLPAMIRKFHEAKINNLKEIAMWGTGKAIREFMNSDDLADACLFLMNNYNDPSIINIGTGESITIKKLAEIIKSVVGFKGKIIWDETKPEGLSKKILDVSKLHNLGWKHKISLDKGIRDTYNWYKLNQIK